MKSTRCGHAEISLFWRDEDSKPATVNIAISSKIFLPKAFQGNHEKASEINMDEILGTHGYNEQWLIEKMGFRSPNQVRREYAFDRKAA